MNFRSFWTDLVAKARPRKPALRPVSADPQVLLAKVNHLLSANQKDLSTLRSHLTALGRAEMYGSQLLVWAKIFRSEVPEPAEMDRAVRIMGRAITHPDFIDDDATLAALETVVGRAMESGPTDRLWVRPISQAAVRMSQHPRGDVTAAACDYLALHLSGGQVMVLSEQVARPDPWLSSMYAAYMRAKKFADAQRVIMALARLRPKNGKYAYRLADVMLRRKHPREVIAEMKASRADQLSISDCGRIVKRLGYARRELAEDLLQMSSRLLVLFYLGRAAWNSNPTFQAALEEALQGRSPQEVVGSLSVIIADEPNALEPSILIDAARAIAHLDPKFSGPLREWADGLLKGEINPALAVGKDFPGSDGVDPAIQLRDRKVTALFSGVTNFNDLVGIKAGGKKVDRFDLVVTFGQLSAHAQPLMGGILSQAEVLRFGARSKSDPESLVALADVESTLNSVADFASAALARKCANWAVTRMAEAAPPGSELLLEDALKLAFEDRFFACGKRKQSLLDHVAQIGAEEILVIVRDNRLLPALEVAWWLARHKLSVSLFFDVQMGADRNNLLAMWRGPVRSPKDLLLNLAASYLGQGEETKLSPALIPKLDDDISIHGEKALLVASLSDSSYLSSAVSLYHGLASTMSVEVYNGAPKGDEPFLVRTGMDPAHMVARRAASEEETSAVNSALRLLLSELRSARSSKVSTALIANVARLVSAVRIGLLDQVTQTRQLAERLAEGDIAVVLTLPGRMPCARSASILARQIAVPVVDVQAIFITAHPRYRLSLADVYCALTDDQIRFYMDKQPAPSQRIERVGSLMIADQLARVQDITRDDARRSLGITDERTLIVYAAQHGLGREADDAAVMITQAANAVENSLLIIKAHPRTSQDAFDRMSQQAARAAKGEVRVIKDGNIYAMMKASDLVVTQFSNVGLEAAVIGLPVVSINTSGRDYAVDLVPMGVAVRATSVTDLTDKVRALLGGGAEAEAHRLAQTSFFQRNPELLNMSAPAGIAAIAQDLMRTSRRARAGRA